MGMVHKASGAASATVVGPFKEQRIAKAPTVMPISILPASPKKIEAGGKLNQRNPNKLPASASATAASAW